MDQLAPGLWRWTAPHPEWRAGAATDSPDDWEQMVGCLLYQGPDTSVFIDPLLPPDQEAFWRWADEQVGGRTASVLTTLAPHRRDRELVATRYGARTSTDRPLPPGVRPSPGCIGPRWTGRGCAVCCCRCSIYRSSWWSCPTVSPCAATPAQR
jgi:hypothetical protein